MSIEVIIAATAAIAVAELVWLFILDRALCQAHRLLLQLSQELRGTVDAQVELHGEERKRITTMEDHLQKQTTLHIAKQPDPDWQKLNGDVQHLLRAVAHLQSLHAVESK